MGRAVDGVDGTEGRRQQTVAAHREEDPRLAELEHEQDRGHRDDGADRDDELSPADAGDLEGARQRVRARQLLERHQACRHEADHGVDDRAHDERPQDAPRHVALRVARLLGRGRDGVEADVGEEDERRALVDAAPAVRREGRPVARVEVERTHAHEDREHGQLQHHHGVVEPRARADPDHEHPGDERDHHDPRQVDRDRLAEEVRQARPADPGR